MLDIDSEKVKQYFDIQEENPKFWNEPKELPESDNFSKQQDHVHSEKGKSSLLRQLLAASNTASNIQLPQDEPDPLGSTNSVMSVLKARNIDVSESSKRSKYMVSSTKFNPRVFLRDVHPDATYENLVNSLGFLESRISERSEALRFLVEHDYERFVTSKSKLDEVFTNMERKGVVEKDNWGFGELVQWIDEASAKGTLVMKPVLDNRAKFDRLKLALKVIEENKYLFDLPSAILHHVKVNDHDSLIRDYRRGRDIRYQESDALIDPAETDYFEQKKVTDRIWDQVRNIIEDYKKEEWKKLASVSADQNFLGIISKLLELGCEDNPIHEWISSQIQKFEQETAKAFDKLKNTTSSHRINIIAVHQNTSGPLIAVLKDIDNSGTNDILYDNYAVIEMWAILKVVMQEISNIMTRFCQFWQSCKGFLEGTLQKNLPRGWHNESVQHLSLTASEKNEIIQQANHIIDLIASSLTEYFSTMVPVPQGHNPMAASERHGSVANLLTPSKSTGNRRRSAWTSSSDTEVPIFLPPHSNALSTTKYLSAIIFQLANGFTELARLRVSSKTANKLQNVLSLIRDKALYAVVHTWTNDSGSLYLAENWTLSTTSRSLTKLPTHLKTYESLIIKGTRDIMYITDDGKSLDEDTVAPPVTSQLLTLVLGSFSRSISVALDGIMKMVLPADNSHRRSVSANSILSPSSANPLVAPIDTSELIPDGLSVDMKTLLTISNIAEIRDGLLPYLFKLYEKSFKMSSRESANTIKASLDTMDSTLFELYTRRKKTVLAELLRTAILKSGLDWSSDSPPPTGVSSYMYDCLLTMVVTHSHVLSIAPAQVPRVITTLYSHVVQTLLSTYRDIESFGHAGLLQVIADIGFLRITLEKYQTSELLNTYSLMYESVKEATTKKEWWDSENPPWKQIHSVVADAQTSSKMDFRCFSATL